MMKHPDTGDRARRRSLRALSCLLIGVKLGALRIALWAIVGAFGCGIVAWTVHALAEWRRDRKGR